MFLDKFWELWLGTCLEIGANCELQILAVAIVARGLKVRPSPPHFFGAGFGHPPSPGVQGVGHAKA